MYCETPPRLAYIWAKLGWMEHRFWRYATIATAACHSITHRLRTCPAITVEGTKGRLVAVGDAVYTDTIIVLKHFLDIFFASVYPSGTMLINVEFSKK